ncbi:MAG: hypothetical protein JWO94_1786, partial [Verrucomicrobiaceae bacterium]|nr:hypothetical protein [Verrucomicrobiaceae bacterium]
PPRLCGLNVAETDKLVQKLGKKRDYASLVSVPLVNESEGLTCLAEDMVDGVALADVIRERGAVGVSEAYLVLAGLDASLTQLERASLGTRKLRLEDMFLLTGFSRDDSRSTRLLTTKLNEWPSFTVMLRVHPTLASMSGRGINPGALLPPPAMNKSSIWHGGWMAALGVTLLGLDNGLPEGSRELEAVSRLLDDEMTKTREGQISGRSDFLARFARVIQHYDLVAAAPIPVPKVPPAKPRVEPRQVAKKATPIPIAAPEPVAPMMGLGALAPLTAGIDPDGEKATIGFAELLFQSPPAEPAKRSGFWGQGTGAGADYSSSHAGSWGIEESDHSPWWLKATVFLAGSMMAGAVCAHLTGGAQWQKSRLHSEPVPPAVTAPVVPGKTKASVK